MMAITVCQPVGTLIAIRAKNFETRGWRTKRRGLLAVHAAKAWTAVYLSWIDREPGAGVLAAAGVTLNDIDDARGHVVAVAHLVDCVPIRELGVLPTETHGIAPAEHELAFGAYAPGRWAWILRDVVRLETPVRAVGKQGLWEISDELVATGYPKEARHG